MPLGFKANGLIIAGLGNPGTKYKNNRHNIGFKILDSLSYKFNTTFKLESKFNAEVARLESNIYLIKPQTFMNNSGVAILGLKQFYKLDSLFVIHDELDLKFGELKFKNGGGNGGHNGLKSIDSSVGNNYFRLRFGIGRSNNPLMSVADYVLSDFNEAESKLLDELIQTSTQAIEFYLKSNDFNATQNKFTKKLETKQKDLDSSPQKSREND